MTTRRIILALSVMAVCTAPSLTTARRPVAGPRIEPTLSHPVSIETGLVEHAARTARGAADTIWFGGLGSDGLAEVGGVWDFEDGTLQGWTSEDLSGGGVDAFGNPFFRHRTTIDFVDDPVSAIIDGDGSLWVGAHDAEAAEDCWPGGMGYDNLWTVSATKTFSYTGVGVVTIEFDYFTDSETDFDITSLYTVVDGVRSDPLAEYSGSTQEGTAIGTPSSPAHESLVIQVDDLPIGAGDFDVVFEFVSDPLFSDGRDSFSGFLNSVYGAFGLDNFSIAGTGLSDTDDFESGPEEWAFFAAPPIGTYLDVTHLDDLPPIEDDPCTCPLADPENAYVMTAFDGVGPEVHPEGQHELMRSPPLYVGPGSPVEGRSDWRVMWNTYGARANAGVGYRVGISYYPWTCEATGVVGWSRDFVGVGGFLFLPDQCARVIEDVSPYIPGDADSLAVAIELLVNCDDFGSCNPERRDERPYWDDIRIAAVGDGLDVPAIALELLYQDVFPQESSLSPTATADVHSFFDNNRLDGDQTNANMGDSAVVISEPGAEVYLNFRVHPGPAIDDGDYAAFLDARGGAVGGAGDRVDYLAVRMEALPSPRDEHFATYVHDDGVLDADDPKILPDGLFTPGTTVEYFFSSEGPGGTRVAPDTTDGALEFEVLPGWRESPGGALVTSCVLYVDAANDGRQHVIENAGLRPILGASDDVEGRTRDNWDRYDYLAASSNVPAPLGRELFGDNGMTLFQSLAYNTILYNTGSRSQEGLRDQDARILIQNVEAPRCDDSLTRGLWLNGDHVTRILSRSGRPYSNRLLERYAQAFRRGDYESLSGDGSACVRLDPSGGRHFPVGGESYASVARAGCSTLTPFDVIGVESEGVGNLEYIDQDSGGAAEMYASVSNDQDASRSQRVVTDSFSLDLLRTTPDGWTGSGPGGGACEDLTAIARRVADVFEWLGVPVDPLKDPDCVIAVEPSPGLGALAITRLVSAAPNPFNPTTTLRYVLGESGFVTLKVYDVNGRRVRTLVSSAQDPAIHAVTWDGLDDAGKEVGSGVYWARMTTSFGFRSRTKLVVLK